MIRFFTAICGSALLAAWFGAPFAVGTEEKPGKADAVFEMREVSALQKNGIQDNPYDLTVGTFAACSSKPDRAVKAYPKLHSKHPLYGTFQFDRNYRTGKSIEIRFVLDESGEIPPAEEKKQEENAKQAKAAKPRPAPPKLSRYNRLYIDLNRDLDLTNDPVLKPLQDPPWQALPPWKTKERMVFGCVNIDVDYGPGVGVRPFRILPLLTGGGGAAEHDRYTMHFVATAARQGRIRIDKHEYNALLAQPYLLAGRYDRPMTALFLKPIGTAEKLDSGAFSGEMLSTVQRVDGQLYIISATPLGDKLTVKPYRGNFGILKIGPGGRDIKDFSFAGALASETMSLALRPDPALPEQKQEKVRQYRVPVGDYLPSYLSVEYGHLRLSLSENYHSDGRPRGFDRPKVFFIKVRKDKPFVLDFSNKPVVLFASPAKDAIFNPGAEVSVKAVLIDPVFDIMIRRLCDTSRKKKEIIRYGEGKAAKESAYEAPLSLDPTVTITNSAGKKVAEGVMPFG